MVDVNVIGAQAAKRSLASGNKVVARGAKIIRQLGRSNAAESGFGRDEEFVAASGDGLTENFFGRSVGIPVGGVEKIDAGVEADGDELFCFVDLGGAPGFEEFVGAAEGAGAEGNFGNCEAGIAEETILHRCVLAFAIADFGQELDVRARE